MSAQKQAKKQKKFIVKTHERAHKLTFISLIHFTLHRQFRNINSRDVMAKRFSDFPSFESSQEYFMYSKNIPNNTFTFIYYNFLCF